MLKTPLGNLIVQKNNIEIDYSVIPQPLRIFDKLNYYVDARYLIDIDTKTIKSGDTIKYFIDCKNVETDIDGGEYLALLNLRKNNLLMSLGVYEILYHSHKKDFGFDICYIDNGLESYFIDNKYTEKFKLAISWIELKDDLDEISTWYASDPTLFN